MPSAKPSPPRLSDPTEISVTCEWDPVDGAQGYAILVKSVADDDRPWTTAARHDFPADGPSSAEVDGLEPTNTYVFRLLWVGADGADSELSDEAVIDTLVAGCGGASGEKKKAGGCCVIC